MVWDTIRPMSGTPLERWGGICYSLAAFEAVLDPTFEPSWEVVPFIKVGHDMWDEAVDFLTSLGCVSSLEGVRVVPDPNNRVQLQYKDADNRVETLAGGVPGWRVEEILPLVTACDALYVNFISGSELDLATAVAIRAAGRYHVYADLHSLLLDVGPGGIRRSRPLADAPQWLSCFDMVQVNDTELATLAADEEDPLRFADEVVGSMTGMLFVTHGARGATWTSSHPTTWRCHEGARRRVERGEVAGRGRADGDPTGCGDVWGAVCFASLLAGHGPQEAAELATRLATQNVGYRGATGLAGHLRGSVPA